MGNGIKIIKRSVGKIGYYEPDAYYIKDYSLCQETTCQISQQMVSMP